MPTVSSPCIKNCCLDKKDICIGCGRSVQEIIRWSGADDEEKSQILVAAKNRKNKRAKNSFEV